MPKISEKGISVPASPIRKLAKYADAAKASGKKVYHLNIGQPDIASPKIALDAVKNMHLNLIEYSHSAGFESYRKGWIQYYENLGVSLHLQDMLITTGGSEALVLAFLSTLNPGDEIIIPEPFYANYNSFAKMAGITVKAITCKIEDNFALPNIDTFKQYITPKTKGICICNPGNPTGYIYSQAEIEQIKQLVKEYDLFLFADEVYREFRYDGQKPYTLLQEKGLEQHLIVIDSVSKRYSMCGARVGAVISRNEEVMQAILKFAQARLSPPTLGQIASEAALATDAQYFTDVQAEYLKRRNVLVEGLRKIAGVTCPVPGGAFYVMADLPIDDADKFCQWLLEEFSYENQTVMLAPASGFYANASVGKTQVRMAYVLKEEDLKTAVMLLEKALQAYGQGAC